MNLDQKNVADVSRVLSLLQKMGVRHASFTLDADGAYVQLNASGKICVAGGKALSRAEYYGNIKELREAYREKNWKILVGGDTSPWLCVGGVLAPDSAEATIRAISKFGKSGRRNGSDELSIFIDDTIVAEMV